MFQPLFPPFVRPSLSLACAPTTTAAAAFQQRLFAASGSGNVGCIGPVLVRRRHAVPSGAEWRAIGCGENSSSGFAPGNGRSDCNYGVLRIYSGHLPRRLPVFGRHC